MTEDKWLCTGFLQKESKGDNWNRRFFILDDSSLKYYKRKPTEDDPDGSQCRGEIRIKKIVQVRPSSVWRGQDNCFELVMTNGSPMIYLVAASDGEMQKWISQITSHPLFGLAVKMSIDEGQKGTPSSYKTKIVGGVVIRTEIVSASNQDRRQSLPDSSDLSLETACAASTPSHSTVGVCNSEPPCVVASPSMTQDMGLKMSSSQNSIRSWGSQSMSSQRNHRRDGARVVKCGYCVKQGGRRRTWKRRFFLLDPFGLAYYQHSFAKDPIRNIPLQLLCSVSECTSFPDRTNILQLMTVGRIFYMQADTPADCKAWIDAIKSVLPSPSAVVKDTPRTPQLTPGAKLKMSGEGKQAQQLWRLSLGRCRDYLVTESDESDEEEDPSMLCKDTLMSPAVRRRCVSASEVQKYDSPKGRAYTATQTQAK